MSFDVFIACATAVTLPAQLPSEGNWKRYEFQGDIWFASEHIEQSWQLIVSLDRKTEFTLPADKKHVIALSLEGNVDTGFPLLRKTVEMIAKTGDCMLLQN